VIQSICRDSPHGIRISLSARQNDQYRIRYRRQLLGSSGVSGPPPSCGLHFWLWLRTGKQEGRLKLANRPVYRYVHNYLECLRKYQHFWVVCKCLCGKALRRPEQSGQIRLISPALFRLPQAPVFTSTEGNYGIHNSLAFQQIKVLLC